MADTGSLIQFARQAEIVAPDDHSTTRFAPYVSITPETRDALVEAVEAAADLLWAEEANSQAAEDLALTVCGIEAAEERQRLTRAVGDLAWANLEAALAVLGVEVKE